MGKYVIDGEILKGLADALRKVTGETRSYTPSEMIDAVTNIMETGTYILVDENGTEVPAVFVDNETVFTATANDIRIGTTAVTEAGVTVGEKEIPTYRATEGHVMIEPGQYIEIRMFSDMCQYTTMQGVLCAYNTTVDDSLSVEKVAMNDAVYAVRSTAVLANVDVDVNTQTIKLGMTNDDTYPLIVRFMIIKEDL